MFINELYGMLCDEMCCIFWFDGVLILVLLVVGIGLINVWEIIDVFVDVFNKLFEFMIDWIVLLCVVKMLFFYYFGCVICVVK